MCYGTVELAGPEDHETPPHFTDEETGELVGVELLVTISESQHLGLTGLLPITWLGSSKCPGRLVGVDEESKYLVIARGSCTWWH